VTEPTFVKICGVTRVSDAVRAAELGASAVGVNLVASSKRCVSVDVAREVALALRGHAQVIAVVAGLGAAELRHLLDQTGVDRLQLHGDEPPELLREVGPAAFKALRVRGAEDLGLASTFDCEPLLVDAYVPGELGGTGHRADWELAARIARQRLVLLAGGLRPDDLADALRAVRPWGVDVASGVEISGRPGDKDWGAVRAFIEAARGA
jgi:phosphoribosylanthranilate isomerase